MYCRHNKSDTSQLLTVGWCYKHMRCDKDMRIACSSLEKYNNSIGYLTAMILRGSCSCAETQRRRDTTLLALRTLVYLCGTPYVLAQLLLRTVCAVVLLLKHGVQLPAVAVVNNPITLNLHGKSPNEPLQGMLNDEVHVKQSHNMPPGLHRGHNCWKLAWSTHHHRSWEVGTYIYSNLLLICPEWDEKKPLWVAWGWDVMQRWVQVTAGDKLGAGHLHRHKRNVSSHYQVGMEGMSAHITRLAWHAANSVLQAATWEHCQHALHQPQGAHVAEDVSFTAASRRRLKHDTKTVCCIGSSLYQNIPAWWSSYSSASLYGGAVPASGVRFQMSSGVGLQQLGWGLLTLWTQGCSLISSTASTPTPSPATYSSNAFESKIG